MKQALSGLMLFTALSFALCSYAFTHDSAYLDPDSEAWQLAEHTETLAVYTRPYKDSKFKAFKAVAKLQQPLASVLAVIADPRSCPLWVDSCLSSRNLKITDFSERYGYALNALPWPFKNRDIVVRILTHNPNGRDEIRISMTAEDLPAGESPFEKGTVRINQSDTLYVLRALQDGQTEVQWMQHTEPAGSLPAWLVNVMIDDLPKQSIPLLELVAGQERYRDAQINYDETGVINGLTLVSGENLNQPPFPKAHTLSK